MTRGGFCRVFTIISIASAISLSAGCGDIKAKRQSSSLDQTVKAYAGSIRWHNYDSLAAFIKPRQGEPAPVDTTPLKQIRFTNYETRVRKVSDTGDEAVVGLSFDYYYLDSGMIRNQVERTIWWYDEESQTWFLDGKLPVFKR